MASSTRPLVTAIVPTYNGEQFVDRTLKCLAEQTWSPLEILIGDDASTDRTPQIVADFAASHDNVTLVQRTDNLGWLRNCNALMAQASGELLFFAFHDDVVAPTYVERLATALLAHPRAVLAFSDMTVAEVGGEPEAAVFTALEGRTNTLDRGFAMAKRPDDWWVPNRGLFRASAFRAVGGIRPNELGEYSADWTWLLALALRGEFVRVPEMLCEKFYKPGSLSKTWSHDDASWRALARAAIEEIRRSPLGPFEKAVLIASLQDRVKLPGWLRHVGRRAAVLARR